MRLFAPIADTRSALRPIACAPLTLALGALTLGALTLPGCAGREKDPALVAYQSFASSVRGGRADRVWNGLTPESRARLAKSLGIAADATGKQAADVLGVRPGWQFEFDLPQQAKMDREASTPDRRVVRGPLAGRQWRIVMRQVDGEWRVDLDASRPADPQPG
ncbi:MAG: hypothetical protein ACI9U2_002677 [Bradymonadia bacterium]|jgi:hypothetical protein